MPSSFGVIAFHGSPLSEANLANLDKAIDLFVDAGMAVMLDFHADPLREDARSRELNSSGFSSIRKWPVPGICVYSAFGKCACTDSRVDIGSV